jgi:23S rRNA (uracil1939-C5)-methyltransferase
MLGRKSKNSMLQKVRFEAMAAEGKCLAKVDGKVLFAEYAAPGDVADVWLTKVRNKFAEGEIKKLISPSPKRIDPFCKHFGVCGGCKWQHIDYEEQLKFKEQQVRDVLDRIAKIPYADFRPIMGCKQDRAYRNKLDFTFSNKRWLTREEIAGGEIFEPNALGFHVRQAFDKVLAIEECHLMSEPSDSIRNGVFRFALDHEIPFYDLKTQESGFLRNLIIRQSSTGQIMVILQVVDDKPEWLHAVLDYLKDHFPAITSLQYIINRKRNESYFDQDVICYHGKPYIEEEMEGLIFRVGPKSFYQTNSQQAYELYKVARDFAGLTGNENVYDLYTGTGTIANFVAAKAGQVVGVESVPEAIEDAKLNSQINGINNTIFYAGDMKDILDEQFLARHGKPDVIITDPPRAGMHADVVEVLNRSDADRIVYVSCNPATQARDLALMHDYYDVVAVQPVDMFPQTAHVENVVLLKKRNS